MGFWSKLMGGDKAPQVTPEATAPAAPRNEVAPDEAMAAALREAGFPDVHWVRVGDDVHAHVRVPGTEAVATWTRLREKLAPHGLYPVLLGEPEDARVYDTHEEEPGTAAELAREVEAAGAFDAAAWAREKLEDGARELREYDDGEQAAEQLSAAVRLLDEPSEATWPEGLDPLNDFAIPTDIVKRRPLPQVVLAVVRASASWQVPLQLRFGAWNDCPEPVTHARLFRSWEERFGAEVVGITHDIVELRVARPPTDRETALRLAVEHYAYCADIVEQGVESVEGLAATLLNAPVWFFWWD